LRVEGKNRQAYDLVQTFPDNLKYQKEFLLMSVSFASAFDDDIYRSQLSELAQRYGDDPKQAFMLIDHYFYEEDWVSAANAIQISKKEWADDDALNILLVEILIRSGQDDAAVEASLQAISIAPNNEDAYWAALSSYNKTAQFDQAVSVLTTLQEKFSYTFTTEEFQKNPEYNGLVASDAFVEWIGQ